MDDSEEKTDVHENAYRDLEAVSGGLVLLLMALKAGDPTEEIIWRVEEELSHLQRLLNAAQ